MVRWAGGWAGGKARGSRPTNANVSIQCLVSTIGEQGPGASTPVGRQAARRVAWQGRTSVQRIQHRLPPERVRGIRDVRLKEYRDRLSRIRQVRERETQTKQSETETKPDKYA